MVGSRSKSTTDTDEDRLSSSSGCAPTRRGRRGTNQLDATEGNTLRVTVS